MHGTEITPASAFELPLAEESASQLTIFSQTEVTAEIIGISALNNHYTCTACNRSLEEKGKLGTCTSSSWKLTQKLSNANRRWSAKLFVQIVNEATTLHLTLYHSMVVKLLEIGNSDLDLLTCSDDELTNVILELPCLQLKYDTNSKVTELSPVDI